MRRLDKLVDSLPDLSRLWTGERPVNQVVGDSGFAIPEGELQQLFDRYLPSATGGLSRQRTRVGDVRAFLPRRGGEVWADCGSGNANVYSATIEAA